MANNDWLDYIQHSAKGSSWKKHKYIKKVDGKYFYPKGYGEDGEEYDQKHEYGVVLDAVESGVYDYINYQLQKDPGSFDPKNLSAETMKNYIKEYIKFVGGDPSKIPDSEYSKLQRNVDRHYKSDGTFTKKDVDDLAREAAKGSFGDEKAQKEIFGDDYEKIKKRMAEQKSEESGKKSEKSGNDTKTKSGKSKDDDWEKKYYEDTAQYLEEGSDYKPAQTLKDFVVELNEAGVNTDDYSDSQLKSMYEKVRKQYKLDHSEDLGDQSEYLMHYGILGMKWGVRRTPAQLARARGSSKKSSSEDHHEDYKKAHDSKSVKSMSDAELRSRINRLQMEQQYSQLTLSPSNRSAIQKGKSIVGKALAGAVTATATAYATKYANKGMKIVNELYIKPHADNLEKKVMNNVAANVISKHLEKAAKKM